MKAREEDPSAQTGGHQTQTQSLPTELSEGFYQSSSSLERLVLSASDAALQGNQAEGVVALPLPESLALEQTATRFLREGFDLVIKVDAKVVVIEGYFSALPPPTLTLDNGGKLSPAMVASFLEQGADTPQKYALGWLKGKLGATDEGTPTIGEIVSTEGKVQVVRDGLVIQLKAGDSVLEGDIISTGKGAEVFMRFTDQMEFRLGEEARLAIDQYLYDDVSSNGIQVLSIIAGAFSYASGLIAGASPASVRLQTPQGVIGIRGTKILGEVGDGKLSVTVLEGKVALLQDNQEVTVLDESFETLRVVSANGASQVTTSIASVEEVLEEYDFLDGSEQQLSALVAGEPLPDETRTQEINTEINTETNSETGETEEEANSEAALLPVSGEVYIVAPLAEEESESFLESEEENSVVTTTQDQQETAEEDAEENDVEEEITVEPQSPYFDATLSAGELSFADSSTGVRFDFSDGSDLAFDDTASRVFAHGANVGVVRQLQAGSESQFEFVVSGVVDATGTDKDDTLTGDGAANRLSGGAGTDILTGGAGADTLSGGASGDNLYGGDGFDTLIGGAGDDLLDGGGYGDLLEGGEGADTYVFGRGHGADAIRNDDDGGMLQFKGATGLDDFSFARNSGGVTISVGSDSVTIEADAYANGRYSIHYGASNTLLGRLILGTTGNDPSLTGTAEKDLLVGLAGADTLKGDANADTLVGGSGGDTLEGGAGDDLYLFFAFDGTDTVTDDGGKIVFFQGTGNDYTGADYAFARPDINGEAVTLTVSKGGNTLNTIEFTTYPSSGYTFYTRDSNGVETDITTTLPAVPPRQDGSESNPYLATAGADTFTGSADKDWVSYVDSPADSLGNGVNIDISPVPPNPAIVSGGWAAGDTITGINNIIGSAGHDFLRGDADENILRGGAGDDELQGQAGADEVYGDAGNDALFGNAGDDTLYGGAGNDQLYGRDGNDILHGGADDDLFNGGADDDTLYGDAGDDTLSGDAGDDTLDGGAGADTYAFNAGQGTDTLIDTDGGGTIIFAPSISYAGATYTFTRPDPAGDAVTLTVSDSGGNTINVIKFSDDSSGYSFYTRSGGIDTEIPASSLVVPPRLGSESNPFLATAGADTFTGSAGADWVSYAESTDTRGVYVDLRTNPASVARGATGDTLTGINNIIGSDHNDWFEGGAGTDTLDGGAGEDNAGYTLSAKGVRVNLALTTAQIDFDGSHGFTANNNDAVGDILSNFEKITASGHNDWLTGDNKDNILIGNFGDDRLEGGAGADTYKFLVSDGTDTITDIAGDTMILQFEGRAYTVADFVTANINRVGDNLVITIDKDSTDGITDKITIENAYDTDTSTGTGNAAFTINIEFGTYGSSFTLVTDDFWHTL